MKWELSFLQSSSFFVKSQIFSKKNHLGSRRAAVPYSKNANCRIHRKWTISHEMSEILTHIDMSLWFPVFWQVLWFPRSQDFFHKSQICFRPKFVEISYSMSCLCRNVQKFGILPKSTHITWNVWHSDTNRYDFVISSFWQELKFPWSQNCFHKSHIFFRPKLVEISQSTSCIFRNIQSLKNAKNWPISYQIPGFSGKSEWFCDFELYWQELRFHRGQNLFSQVSDLFSTKISWDLAEHALLMQKYTKFRNLPKLRHITYFQWTW